MSESGQREPDHTSDAPGDVSTGQGYPEEEPGGANPSGSDGRSEGPEDAGDLREDPPAPDTGEDEDSGPGTATGNPGAAGA